MATSRPEGQDQAGFLDGTIHLGPVITYGKFIDG